MSKRRLNGFLGVLSGFAAAFFMVSAAKAAAEYPIRPIRIIVPQLPGAFTDLTARLIGQKLSESFKQPVVVDNRPGAGTTHGPDLVISHCRHRRAARFCLVCRQRAPQYQGRIAGIERRLTSRSTGPQAFPYGAA